jgi:hypothetical protein
MNPVDALQDILERSGETVDKASFDAMRRYCSELSPEDEELLREYMRPAVKTIGAQIEARVIHWITEEEERAVLARCGPRCPRCGKGSATTVLKPFQSGESEPGKSS